MSYCVIRYHTVFVLSYGILFYIPLSKFISILQKGKRIFNCSESHFENQELKEGKYCFKTVASSCWHKLDKENKSDNCLNRANEQSSIFCHLLSSFTEF